MKATNNNRLNVSQTNQKSKRRDKENIRRKFSWDEIMKYLYSNKCSTILSAVREVQHRPVEGV